MNEPLKQYLIGFIKQKGPLTISQYMNLSLYHSQYGYYRTQNPLGTHGDFITSPEISQMFGEIIGICFLELWQRMGKPAEIHLIELGPGQGTLMQDFLNVVSDDFKEAIDLHFVDINPVLRQEQRKRLCHPRLSWHEDLEAALVSCQRAPTFILANEFFDALPIHQYVMTLHGWVERMITFIEDRDCFVFTTAPLTNKARQELPLPSNLPPGSIFEVCYGARYMTLTLSKHLNRQGGAALIIDYGHTQSAPGDTLQAVRQHSYHDILVAPGTADLTAHVDFVALRDIASDEGAIVLGPTNQGSFLSELGIDIRAHKLKQNAKAGQDTEIDRALHRLIHPTQMGELFKVMAITAPQTPTPCGFALCTPQTSSAA